jgi:hypothetical protein
MLLRNLLPLFVLIGEEHYDDDDVADIATDVAATYVADVAVAFAADVANFCCSYVTAGFVLFYHAILLLPMPPY